MCLTLSLSLIILILCVLELWLSWRFPLDIIENAFSANGHSPIHAHDFKLWVKEATVTIPICLFTIQLSSGYDTKASFTGHTFIIRLKKVTLRPWLLTVWPWSVVAHGGCVVNASVKYEVPVLLRKCSSLTVACMLFSHQNAVVKSCLDYVTPPNILSLLLEQKDTSPSSTMPWPTTKNNNQK